jgi:hypothetical protein
MKRISVLIMLAVGCGPFTRLPDQKDSNTPQPIVIEHAPASEIWIALAHVVETGGVPNLKELSRLVKVLADNGELASADVVAFDAAFPGAPTSVKDLEERAVSQKLRGIR